MGPGNRKSVSAVLDMGLDYKPQSGVYDMFKSASGEIRPHWRSVLAELSALDQEEYARRLASAKRMIRDNGVTYNVYDGAGGQARPWDLDLWPVVMTDGEWAAIDDGVQQRARLHNALIGDIYGEQNAIREGVLPLHAIEGHPQYLRPIRGVRPPGGVFVHLYAADLVRDASGRWVVLSERLDAPTGAGYALENRIVVSQTFPELYRDAGVRRVAAFFQSWRDSIMTLAGRGTPRAVLLTPGSHNEAYFEHAYLARYLGLSLVEGQDLAALDTGVFMRTLSGLERVDVILRRVDSDFADPLELRNDSALGVPGLVEAVRNGRVVMANALGGSVAEAPLIAAFIAPLCDYFLKERLDLPGMPTLWCGDPDQAATALKRADKLLFRNAFDNRPLFSANSTAVAGASLNPEALAKLSRQINLRGTTYVAQEMPQFATVPAFQEGRLIPRPMALRVYAAWTAGGYTVMPGGLARVARQDGLPAMNMQSGAASKDTWVLADGPVDVFSLLPSPSKPLEIRRAGDEAPSRAMDNLFWLGRYAERAEDMGRTLRAIVLRLGDDTGLQSAAMAANLTESLLVPLGRATPAALAEARQGDVTRLAVELDSLILSPRRADGLHSLLKDVTRTAWNVRDRLSVDAWRAIEALSDRAPDAAPLAPDPAGAKSFLDDLVQRAAALSGLTSENMTRSRNWLFLELGRRIERAQALIWLIRQLAGDGKQADEKALPLALEIADSAMTYRSRYFGIMQLAPVLDLLLLDESNPRSLAFQASRLSSLVTQLPRANATQVRGLDKEIAIALYARLRQSDPQTLARLDGEVRVELTLLLDFCTTMLTRLSDVIHQNYFRQSTRRRTGSAPRKEGA